MADAHLFRAPSAVSTVFCLFSSSIRVIVTCFSLSLDSVVDIGGVTPKYLQIIRISMMLCMFSTREIPNPLLVAIVVVRVGESRD